MSKPLLAKYAYSGGLTAAELALAPGPSATQVPTVYVDEFDARYRWTPGSAVAADGFRVIGHTGGVAGRWILDGTAITLAPRGGILDDWARVAAAMAAMAYQGEIRMATGSWIANTNQITPSGTTMIWAPGSTLAMTLVPGLGFVGSAFFNLGGAQDADTTTVAIAAVAGATAVTMASAAGIAVGDLIMFRNTPAYRCLRKVVTIVGDVVGIDRPLRRPYGIGAGVGVVAAARDIQIQGHGLTVTGTGDAIVQLACGMDCLIEGINDDCTSLTTVAAFNFDIASRDCKFARLRSDGKGVKPYNYLLASAENCEIEDCDGERPSSANISVGDCDDCRIINGTLARSLGVGVRYTSENVADTLGSRGCVMRGTAVLSAAEAGIYVESGSEGNTFEGVDASYNQAGYIFTDGTGPAANHNTILGGVLKGNTQAAIVADGGTVGNKAVGANFAEHDIGVVQVQDGSTFEVIGGSIADTSVAAATQAMLYADGAGSRVIAVGVVATSIRNVQHMFGVQVGGDAQISGGCRYDAAGAVSCGIFMEAGTCRADSFTVVAAGGVGFYLNNAASFARIGSNVNVAGTATPFNVIAGALNRGAVALNGAVAVPIAFAPTNLQDRFFWTYEAAGGVPAGIVIPTRTAGVGFSIVAAAGDTSTINYEIG